LIVKRNVNYLTFYWLNHPFSGGSKLAESSFFSSTAYYVSAGINIVSAGLNVASLHPGLTAIAITTRTSLKANKLAIKAKVMLTPVVEGGVQVRKVVQRLPIGLTGKLKGFGKGVSVFDADVLKSTLEELKAVLSLEQFLAEWVIDLTNLIRRHFMGETDAEKTYNWLKWVTETLEVEAKKAGKL
jgi:hypothetical protein